jgi:glycosyltransferase involved in cell wall biosynthesis
VIEFLHNRQRTMWGRRLFQAYVAEHGLPDVLHVHAYLAGDLARWVKLHYGIPYVLTEHFSHFQDGTLLGWQDRLARRVFCGSSANFAVSQVTCDILAQRYGVPFSMIPNVVKTDVFAPPVKAPARNVAGTRYITIGSLDANKNHQLLLEAFAQAFPRNQEGVSPTLTIVGDGPLGGALQRQVRRLGIADRVVFTGQLSREQVRDVLCQADYYVQCSKVETFAVVLVEAMSCGLPLLSTRSGGPESIITEDCLGFLCDSTVPAVMQGLRALSGAAFDRSRIREHAVRHYSMPVIANRLLTAYRQVVDGSRQSG